MEYSFMYVNRTRVDLVFADYEFLRNVNLEKKEKKNLYFYPLHEKQNTQ